MRTMRRVELLIRLAFGNSNPHEGTAAWDKARELMAANGIAAIHLSRDVQEMYATLSGHAAPAPAAPKKRRTSTTVYQGDVQRSVDDKVWENLTCQRCGQWFTYESYPGNPRSYCDTCRARARKDSDSKRKRDARAARRR